jgi:hypothetical protein
MERRAVPEARLAVAGEWPTAADPPGTPPEPTSWSIVLGAFPARFALAALPGGSAGLRSIISAHQWALSDESSGSILALDLLWCRPVPGSGQVLVCGSERPGSTF